MPNKLPLGWVQTTLGEIVESSRNRVLPREIPDARYVGLEHIESQTMKLLGHGDASDMRSSSMRFSKGDVLYGKMRPYLNKVWVAAFDGLCSAEFIVFPKCAGLNAQFLALRLNAEDFVRFANGQASGERPRVDFQKVSRFPIDLPPSVEQNRIAAKVQTILSAIENAQSATTRALSRLQRYRTLVLDAAITGDLTSKWRNKHSLLEDGAQLEGRILKARRQKWEADHFTSLKSKTKTPTNDAWKARYREPEPPNVRILPKLPKGWTWTTISRLAAHEDHSITDGPFGSNLKRQHYVKSGPRVIRLQNIGDGVFIDEPAHISRKHFQTLKQFAVHAGDLIIRALGMPAPRACAVPKWLGPAIVKADCIKFKVAAEFVAPQFVLFAINAPSTQKRTQSQIHGIGRPRLKLDEIKNIPLPLPPSNEQKVIVAEVQRRVAAADQLRKRLGQAQRRAQKRKDSVLRDAFAGTLVFQDPSEEPASVLLQQIAFRRSEAQTKHPNRMSKIVRSKKNVLLPLLEVLRKRKRPMTPEQLFRQSGYEQMFNDNECRQEIVDEFYDELQKLIGPVGPVRERRPNPRTVFLELTL
jgi:type I restriction enzyme, S subunit